MAVIPRSTAPRIAVVGIVLSFALAVAIGFLRTVNAEPVEGGVEVAGNIGFAIVLAAPGLLGLLGRRGRASLFVAAGVLDLVFAFPMLISLIGLVFVPPAVMFLIAAAWVQGHGTSLARSIATVLVALLGGTGAFFALFVQEDPVCWARNPATGETFRLDASRFVHGSSISMDSRDLPAGTTESGCSSDTISPREGVTATAVVVAMLGTAWALSKPPALRPAPAPTTG
jgi:hypothetical protein